MPAPTCPDCTVPLEGGFLLEHNQSMYRAVTWVEGPPEKSFWSGLKLKGRRRLKVYAWRCPRCTQVRLYAPNEG
ncbi:MAG TPA: PF20097 family protein [Longimicrobium sp.]|nr:PF20097 family protein [Longimicrobium sp.]